MDRTVSEIGLNLLKCLDCLSEPGTYGKNLNKLFGYPHISALLEREKETCLVIFGSASSSVSWLWSLSFHLKIIFPLRILCPFPSPSNFSQSRNNDDNKNELQLWEKTLMLEMSTYSWPAPWPSLPSAFTAPLFAWRVLFSLNRASHWQEGMWTLGGQECIYGLFTLCTTWGIDNIPRGWALSWWHLPFSASLGSKGGPLSLFLPFVHL